ncbi:molybdenum cofactor biosynthesis protein MoaE [Belliella kenyensis]|uniref:Molybdopterin synthase catalytic subunit n=1 Tax=Belliella kenyensis TaxID=1472724 RepID=A0ABV8EHP2_9BACT|nr:molybdenum cofactor biosynthesis protein MoaE [Belliella kenyensis]MCH7401061.1 molybdenum cofactor biosynthesis protein MoaE [Belliella kenyensis]MDN3604059.1 molybdenum cofactor biosynthesis protein MoaE [Belliella kenyensis]
MKKQRTAKNIFVNGAISPEKIAQSIANHASKTDIGGHSIFLGQVRADMKEEGMVKAIEYTAYEDMALQQAFEIREAIFAKYPLTCMHIYHSLGEVKVGEICLFVFTSSKHRKAAMEACEELVERIKKELPIWGKEIIDNENSAWKVNT